MIPKCESAVSGVKNCAELSVLDGKVSIFLHHKYRYIGPLPHPDLSIFPKGIQIRNADTSQLFVLLRMVYPLPSLKAQIIAMYRRSEFESLLEKWTNRDEEAGLYTDIYDGEIWKTFPSS